MADWKFELFKVELEQLANDACYVTLNKENFSYKDFGLICEMMEGTKKDWTTIELIDLLIIGEQFLASGEAKEKIILIAAMEMFGKNLDKEIVTMFPYLEVNIFELINALQHPSVSIVSEKGHEFLQLDGDMVSENDIKKILECLLLMAKCFNYIRIVYFKFTKENLQGIDEQLKNESIVFTQTVGQQQSIQEKILKYFLRSLILSGIFIF